MKFPLILCILDGFGHGPSGDDNAISLAKTPTLDNWYKEMPWALVEASGEHVGLPPSQMGNSEVGHLTIGAGRTLMQDFPRINKAFEAGSFQDEENFQQLLKTTKENKSTCHLFSLFSRGGIHAHLDHLEGIISLFERDGVDYMLHIITDGRDTPPQSFLKTAATFFEKFPNALSKVATVMGRFYGMDRDKRWDRVLKAHQAILKGEGEKTSDLFSAIQASYEKGIGDEFISPLILNDYKGPSPQDTLFVTNFRADRVRQILGSFLREDFEGREEEAFYPLSEFRFSYVLGMVSYEEKLSPFIHTLFPPETPKNSLGEVISKEELTQLRLAETEKYAHVTFFFNGGEEMPFNGEDRILIPSPKVETYDLDPKMSAFKVLDTLKESICDHHYDFVLVNFANPDMVGHTGRMGATIEAIEVMDLCLERLQDFCKIHDITLLVTADHGNAEKMKDEAGGPFTAHTTNPVPLFLLHPKENYKVKNGALKDVAPTVLDLMNIQKPLEMTGESLVEKV